MTSKAPAAPPPPDYAGQAAAQGQANIEAARLTNRMNKPDEVTPFGSRIWSDLGADRYTVTSTLSPDQQKILDQQENIDIKLGDMGTQQLGRIDSNLSQPFNMSNLPDRVDSVDFSSLPRLPGSDDFSADRQLVSDTMYNMATRSLDPQFQQTEKDMRTQLINSGIREGSEAWNSEFDRFNRSKADAYGDARDRSILAGGTEQSRLFGQGVTGRQQALSEILQDASLRNSGRQAGIQEESFLRNLPLNELTALLSGSQIQQPTFGGFAPGSNVAPAPVAQAGALQNQNAMDAYNAQVAQSNARNANQAGLAGTGMTAAAMYAAGMF